MNLHGIVAPAIGAVNPFVPVTLKRSNGYTIEPDGTQVPSYVDVPLSVQVQALSFSDLQQLDGLNIQGVRRAVYLDGPTMGVVRNIGAGGDLFAFPPGLLPEGDLWLAAHVLERWPDWSKVAITLQVSG
nr:MAG TPA: head closure knob [Caudoviricetes sp.]